MTTVQTVVIVILAIGVVQFLFFLFHWILYLGLVKFLAIQNPVLLKSLRISLGLLSFVFVLASLLSSRFSNIFVRLFYNFAASWIGFFYFMFLAICFCWLVYGLSKLFGFSLDMKFLTGFLLVMAVAIGIYGIINANATRLTKISVKLPNLPQSWQGKTAVWISDMHFGQVRGYGFAKKIADKIIKLNPDIVFIGGDLYDGMTADLDKFSEPFSLVKPPQGIYFVTGNHEEIGDNAKYLEAVREANIIVLNNEMVNLDGLQIIGVDYRDAKGQDNLKSILNLLHINKNQPSILLKHEPFDIQAAQEAGVSLEVCGHTHQGQVFPINFINRLIYSGYNSGFKKLGDMIVYISSGVGTWGPPMRVGSNPEILEITFK